MSLYAKLDVDFASDPRVIEAGPMAELLYVRALLYSRRALSDGFVDRRVLILLTQGFHRPIVKYAERLVTVGLWEQAPGGWQIPERIWRKWNPTSDEVQAHRDAEAQRKAEYRARKAVADVSQRDNSGTQHVSQRDAGTRPRTTETETETEKKNLSLIREIVTNGATDARRERESL